MLVARQDLDLASMEALSVGQVSADLYICSEIDSCSSSQLISTLRPGTTNVLR
jgi:hypothetical protein